MAPFRLFNQGRRAPDTPAEEAARAHHEGVRRAIAEGKLVLRYQPKVNLSTGQVTGVEALAYWPHYYRGPLPQQRILPLNDAGLLLYDVTRWMLDAALRQRQLWHAEGLRLEVAVNVALDLVEEPEIWWNEFLPLFQEGAPADGALALELSYNRPVWGEIAQATDLDTVVEGLAPLAAGGVRLILDGVGMVTTPLALLTSLPVTGLKLDRTLVTDPQANGRSRTVVAALVDLGHRLGLTVAADAVDDRHTWEWLGEVGCDIAQGDYISGPLPAADLERWLRTRANRVRS